MLMLLLLLLLLLLLVCREWSRVPEEVEAPVRNAVLHLKRVSVSPPAAAAACLQRVEPRA
jgi:hypothetical protein